jgi:ADP-ribose pyrophosphatase
MTKKWKTIKSEIVHQNPWWRVRKDDFEFPSGKRGEYYIVDIKGGVFVVPVIDEKIVFVQQFRYPVGRTALELPNGCVKKELSVIDAASEELREEIGYESKEMKEIGQFATSGGVTSEVCYVYLATNLKFVGEEREKTEIESQMKTVEIEIEKAYEMLDSGEFFDGQTIAALTLVRKHLIKK